jgi:hypothetical protein
MRRHFAFILLALPGVGRVSLAARTSTAIKQSLTCIG